MTEQMMVASHGQECPCRPTPPTPSPTGEPTNRDYFGYSVGYLSVIKGFPLQTEWTNRQRRQLWFRLALWYCLFSRSKWDTLLTPLPTHSSHVCYSSLSLEYPCTIPYTCHMFHQFLYVAMSINTNEIIRIRDVSHRCRMSHCYLSERLKMAAMVSSH